MPKKFQSEIDPRLWDIDRAIAIRDAYDVCTELMTNADDALQELFRQKKKSSKGEIIIFHSNRSLTIQDQALGMSEEKIEEVLKRVGSRQSYDQSRGFFGRGLKDIVELADIHIETICRNQYCEATYQLPRNAEIDDPRKAIKADRERLGIDVGRNGTSVKVDFREGVTVPRFEQLSRDLPWVCGIRHIMMDPDVKVYLKRGNKKVELKSSFPKSKVVFEGNIEADGAIASFVVRKADDPIEEPKHRRLDKAGFLVIGQRAVHESTYFSQKIKSEPLHRSFLGNLRCPKIDTLMKAWDKEGKTKDNPVPIYDPRRHGVNEEHPLIAMLYSKASEIVYNLIEEEKEKVKKDDRAIANKSTKERLKKLGKVLGKFLHDRLGLLGDEDDESKYRTYLERHGIAIYPHELRIEEGKEQTFHIYVMKEHPNFKKNPGYGNTLNFHIKSNHPKSVNILDKYIKLREAKDRYVGKFTVLAKKEIGTESEITAKCTSFDLPEAMALIAVGPPELRDFSQIVEFKYQSNTIQDGQTKSLSLFGMTSCLEKEKTEIIARVKSSDPSSVEVIDSPITLKFVKGTNYVLGKVRIIGRKLHSKATIKAVVDATWPAETQVTVISSNDPKINIELIPDNFSPRLAKWKEKSADENETILVGANHVTIARYLGPAKDDFPGQDEPLFNAMIANIVTDCIAEKCLTTEVVKTPSNFDLEGTKDQVSEEFYYEDHKRKEMVRKICHEVMCPNPPEIDPKTSKSK